MLVRLLKVKEKKNLPRDTRQRELDEVGKINKQRDIHGDRQTDKGKIQSKTGELYGQRRRMTETHRDKWQEKEWQTDRGKIQSNTDSKRWTKNDIKSDKCDR